MKFEINKETKKPEFKPFSLTLNCETLEDVQRLIQVFSINKEDSKLMESLKNELENMGYNIKEMYKN